MSLLDRRLTLIWLALVAATLVSWGSSAEHPAGVNWIAMLIIAIAFLKVRYIGLEFMELRGAPLPLRIAFEGWLVAVASALIVLHAFGALLF